MRIFSRLRDLCFTKRKKAATFAAFLAVIIGFVVCSGSLSFDPVKWKNAEVGSRLYWESTRVRMFDDLVRKHKLVGLTEAEIIVLLGHPTETKESELLYQLGPAGLDSEWLTLTLNEKKVISYKRWSD